MIDRGVASSASLVAVVLGLVVLGLGGGCSLALDFSPLADAAPIDAPVTAAECLASEPNDEPTQAIDIEPGELMAAICGGGESDYFRLTVLATLPVMLSASDDRAPVEEHALQPWIRFEDGGQEAAVSAGDIDQRPEPGELIGSGHCGVLDPGKAGHRFAKHLEILWVLLEILEDRNTVRLEERHLAGLHSIQ